MVEGFEFGVDLASCRENFRKREEQKYREREGSRELARAAIIAAMARILPRYPSVRRAYLFGSVTRAGQFDAHSDIDIAVEGTNAKQYWALWRELDAAIPGCFVDLREINEPSHFARRVQESGELVYEHENTGA